MDRRRDGLERGELLGDALVLLAVLLDHSAGDEILQLLVSAQAQHFFSAAGGIAIAQVQVYHFEKLLELVRGPRGKHRGEFLGDEIREPARKRGFLGNRHRNSRLTCISLFTREILSQ